MSRARNESFEDRALRLSGTLGPVALAVLAVGAGFIAGPPLAVLILAGGALAGAIGTLWSSVRAVVGETPLAAEDAFALGAPSSEEEQKRAVLRAIKDIEFERAVGKISDEDYQALLTRYRADAKRLLRQIDESRAPDRARAEKLAAAYLAKGNAPAKDGETGDDAGEAASDEARETKPESTQAKAGKKGKKSKARAEAKGDADAPSASRACEGCGVKNDGDAAFCKGCGAKLEEVAS